jgi:GTPase SAR1 family protein
MKPIIKTTSTTTNPSSLFNPKFTNVNLGNRLRKVKIVILGKLGVGKNNILILGKTTLMKRYVDGITPNNEMGKESKLSQSYQDDIYIKTTNFKNEDLKLVFIDTPGQNEHTPYLHERYYIGVHAFILMYDVGNKESFDALAHINKILLNSLGTLYVPRIVVGNIKDSDDR